MSVIGSNILAGASGQGGAYNLTNSLRFRSSASAYLNRTPASASNRKTFTWSGWVKRGSLGASRRNMISAGTWSGGNLISAIAFDDGTADTLYVFCDIYGSGNQWQLRTTQVFRDPSAWYHIVVAVDTTQATSSNRVKIYVNGTQVTAFSTATYPSLNFDNPMNNTVVQQIGASTAGEYFDGYQAEVNWIDGQQLTPSSFGETSTTTGVWIPKKYTGTYGTNGFYLPFTDNSALTTSSNVGLGKDFSGNANYWVTNNISITTGSTYDSMTDVPTLTSATAANYCVFNPLDRGSTNFTLSNGNLNIVGASASSAVRATVAVSSGKWYWEATPTAIGNGLGVGFAGDSSRFNVATWNAGTYVIYQSDGNKHINGSASSYGASYTTSDVIGIALDMDAGTITFYKNNTSQGTATTGLTGVYLPVFSQTSGATTGTINANFGAGSGFAYTPPTGFVALNTFNLPTPTIGATASTTANKYFNVLTYAGDGTNGRNITGFGFSPEFLWIKKRSGAEDHKLNDIVRGVDKQLMSNRTEPEYASTDQVKAFLSDGFTTDNSGSTNGSGHTYVSWAWKANGSGSTNTAGSITSTVSASTTAGFSIVTYTGTGSNATVGHGLGVAPSMVIVKTRSLSGNNWQVYHSALGQNKILQLDLTTSVDTVTNYWYNGTTSTVFGVNGSYSGINSNGATYVAYCFAQVAGYSAFGSYTGNGSSDGTFVFTGFRPKFVLIKVSSGTTGNWTLVDTSRNPYNVMNSQLNPDASDAEFSGSNIIDAVSNGFKLRNTPSAFNGSGNTYIYMAFCESPFKYSNAR